MYSSCTSRTSMNVSVDCWVSATNHFFYLFSKTLCSLSDSLTFLSTVSLFFDSTLMNDIVHCTMYDIRFVLVCVCACAWVFLVCVCAWMVRMCAYTSIADTRECCAVYGIPLCELVCVESALCENTIFSLSLSLLSLSWVWICWFYKHTRHKHSHDTTRLSLRWYMLITRTHTPQICVKRNVKIMLKLANAVKSIKFYGYLLHSRPIKL